MRQLNKTARVFTAVLIPSPVPSVSDSMRCCCDSSQKVWFYFLFDVYMYSTQMISHRKDRFEKQNKNKLNLLWGCSRVADNIQNIVFVTQPVYPWPVFGKCFHIVHGFFRIWLFEKKVHAFDFTAEVSAHPRATRWWSVNKKRHK